MSIINTITPPIIIEFVGVSPIPNHTQNGPITISNNIIRLTIAEVVYFGAILKQAKDSGKIISPIQMIVQNGADKILSKVLKENP